MSDAPQDLRQIGWPECFGFTQLFRAFRLAIHPTKLVLAFCGIFGTYFVGRALDGLWPESSQPVVIVGGQIGAADMGAHGATVTELDVFLGSDGGGRSAVLHWRQQHDGQDYVTHVGAFKLLLLHTRRMINAGTDAVLGTDFGQLVAATSTMLMGLIWMLQMHPVFAIFFLLLALVIWAYFGGGVCRAAALHATRDERLGLRDALGFSWQKMLSFFAAPLMPVCVIMLIGLLLFLGGIIGAIPWIGEVLVGLFFVLALCGGFVIAFVLVGSVAGFSLTFPTIAVEGSDAFDALSRSFSYVYQRPWRTVFYAAVSMVYGAICLVFVKLFARLTLAAVHFFVGLSMNWGSATASRGGSDGSATLSDKLDVLWQAPSLAGDTPFWGLFRTETLSGFSAAGQLLIFIWVFAVVGMVGAFCASYYYSSSTLIYLLLRRDVDATDLEDVYLEDDEVDILAPDSPSETHPKTNEESGDTSLPVIEQRDDPSRE